MCSRATSDKVYGAKVPKRIWQIVYGFREVTGGEEVRII
jgi:hypothetical protein